MGTYRGNSAANSYCRIFLVQNIDRLACSDELKLPTLKHASIYFTHYIYISCIYDSLKSSGILKYNFEIRILKISLY